jgi:hypothetical protein
VILPSDGDVGDHKEVSMFFRAGKLDLDLWWILRKAAQATVLRSVTLAAADGPA